MAKPAPKIHPKLYCGTTERLAKLAPVAGINPATERIYLSDFFPGLFAFYAGTNSTERFGIIEIDISFLDQANYLPCEWYLDQTSRQKAKNEREHQKKLDAFRKTLDKYAAKGKKSLQDIGVCVYDALIPKKAISRITIYDPTSNPIITDAILNQRISLSEYKKSQPRNKALTRWLVGEEVSVEEWLGKEVETVTKDDRQKLAEWLQNKSGLDIFYYEPPARGN